MESVLKNGFVYLVASGAILILFSVSFVLAQDGSDMNYVKPQDLDKSHIGRKMHIDFYRRSFGRHRGTGFNLDKVSLEIDGKQVEFIEHREDDGLNNWFSQQYLESTDKKARIKEFKLVGIEKETIIATGYFNIIPFEKEFTIKKTDIAQVLLKALDRN